jgi:DNA-binding transcriptional LysR family regulator
MKLKKIQAFILVIEKGSFSLAAETAGVSQPSISQAIRSLEADLGVQLLIRRNNQITITPAGNYVYSVGKNILEKWQEMFEGLKAYQGTLTGTLNIGASTIPGTYLIPRWIGNFKRLFPKVNVIIETRDSDEIIELLLDRKLDLGIVGSKPESSSILTEVVATDRLTLIVPTGHPLEQISEITLEELLKYEFVIREPGSGTRKALENWLNKHQIDINKLKYVAQFGSTEAIIGAVEEGLGISFVSNLAATRAIKAGKVKIVPLSEDFEQTFFFVCLKGSENYPLINEFSSIIFENEMN